MCKWQNVKLGDVITINSKNLSDNPNMEYINYLDTGNITNGTIDTIQKLYFDTDKIPSRAKRILSKNDVIVSTVRPIQRHFGIISNPVSNMVGSTGFAVLTASEKINPFYLYSFLTQNHIVEYLNNVAETSVTTYPSFKPSLLSKLEIPLPPLEQQQYIASTLSAFDDKIEINKRICSGLEDMARLLFRREFIDNEDSVNWEKVPLSDVANVTMGQSPKGEYLDTGKGYPFLQGSSEFSFKFPIIKRTTTIMTRKANQDDILLSVRAPVGMLNIAPCDNICIGRGLAAIRGKANNHQFIYYILDNLEATWDMFNGTGTVFGSITRKDLENLNIISPPTELLEKFENTVAPMYEKIKILQKENINLRATRDLLLPRLMKGEI